MTIVYSYDFKVNHTYSEGEVKWFETGVALEAERVTVIQNKRVKVWM